MMRKNLFVVFDGIDGSGKSSALIGVHTFLFSLKKYRVLSTREPTRGLYGTQIRELLGKEEDPLSTRDELLRLFLEDRREHLRSTIDPFLDSDHTETHIVLCDRYYYSTIAFQGAQGLDIASLASHMKEFRKPDICFLFDLDPSIALGRMKGRDKEKFEKDGFMQRVRENYLALQDLIPDRIEIVDASQSTDVILEMLKTKIQQLLEE